MNSAQKFVTNFTSTVYTPTPENTAPLLTYPRVIVLEHNGENNGIMLATSESLDENCFLIHKSVDGGRTWKKFSKVVDPDPALVANWQPFLYELPEKVGCFPAGTLLLAGCAHDPKIREMAKITLYMSSDLGENWEFVSVVEAAPGGIEDGVWGPFLIAEKGKLYCFYSDDHDERCNQTIVLRISDDCLTWTDSIKVVACEDSNLRPGMPAVAKMGDGRYIITYEMVCMPGNPVHCKFTSDLADWGNPRHSGHKIITPDGCCVGSAPYCAWTPAGGECGTLIVTGLGCVDCTSETGTDWLVSFDYGNSWDHIPNPLPYPDPKPFDPEHGIRLAYSPCIFVAKDDTLYYANDIHWDYYPACGRRAKIALAHITVK